MNSDEEQQDAVSIMRANGQRVEQYLREVLERVEDAPPRLVEAIEYSLLAGGKRLRPALVLEAHRACVSSPGSTPEGVGMGGAPRSVVAAAGAIELIHTFSLVHDDLPAMDDDDLRRGRPTNHKVFGEAMAILAGDSMMALAFEVLAGDAEPAVAARLVRELAHSAGLAGMIGGQALDIGSQNQSLALDQLQRIHRMKTGALLTAACRLGAIAADASEIQLEAATSYGRHLGLAFQIMDDVLDVTATPQQLGKATNKDVGRGKNTYPALLGLEPSRAEAQRQLQSSLAALAPLGDAGDRLALLARFVVERQS